MGEHTPGPWFPEFSEAYRIRSKKDGGAVAMILHLKGQFGLLGRRLDEESRANAHIVAAAPELLEALEIIVEEGASYEGRFGRKLEWMDMARAAISKARGK